MTNKPCNKVAVAMRRAELRRAPLLDPTFRYTPSSRTDVTQTWRRFGWTPAQGDNR